MNTLVEPRLDRVFSALGDPVRFAIVANLSGNLGGHSTVNDIAALFPISLQAVSKHIKVLEAAGVVTQERHSTGKDVVELNLQPDPQREAAQSTPQQRGPTPTGNHVTRFRYRLRRDS